MIKAVTRNYLINVFALWVTAQYVTGLHLSEGIKSLLIVGAGFTVLHLLLKPLLKLILGPINFLTLGLIGLFIDGGILYLLTLYFPQISVTGWFFPGLITDYFVLPAWDFNTITGTIVVALIINVIRSFLCLLF